VTSTAELLTEELDGVLRVTFNRPETRNAMTWGMWDGLLAAAQRADEDPTVRALVLRGAGGEAFVAGTDISQFHEFTDGEDGVAYEAKVTKVVAALETVAKPTVAVVEGFCVGGGLVIAAACDIRLAAPGSRFGVPVARTVGNCLSMNTYSLLVHHLGPARTLSMLLTAQLMGTEEAAATGFVTPVDDGALDTTLDRLLHRLAGNAPLSVWAAKEAVHRLRMQNLPDGDDIVRRVFASADFKAGVQSFTTKEKPRWQGR
jgi:enoyl-CoA hydratase/carnithine racemase